MRAVILAGGLGTRLREETEYKPKPMVEIGGRPILWHIMKLYAHYGHSDFILCLGYKGNVIREYFLNYEMHNCDVTIQLGAGKIDIHNGHCETGWNVTLAETGEKTLTGGRIKRIARYIEGDTFMVTYGDGVGDVDIKSLVAFHERHGKLGTVTAVHPSARFGQLSIAGSLAKSFREKPQVNEGWINGGFMVFNAKAIEMITGDEESLEEGLLSRLAETGQLMVYQHHGFWQCMDTYREMELLNDMWKQGRAPWGVWANR